MGQGEGQSIVAAAMATFGGGVGIANGGGGEDKPRSFKGHQREISQASSAAADRAIALEEEEEQQAASYRETSNSMEDDERETLLSLLSGAYGQVRVRYLSRWRAERGRW